MISCTLDLFNARFEFWVPQPFMHTKYFETVCNKIHLRYQIIQYSALIRSARNCNYNIIILFIIGMLSKSRGQVLRVAATLHALFHIETPQQLPTNVSDDAIVAAVEFVEVCNQHVAFLSGMGDIDTYITSLQEMQTGNCPLSWYEGSIIQCLYAFQ